MKIDKFEKLEVWIESRELSKEIFAITSVEPFNKDFRFRDQIRSSSGSIMDNIAEGFDRGGNKEFIQFLSIAKGSCAEVRSQLYRAKDYNYVTDQEAEKLVNQAEQVSIHLSGFIKYLRTSGFVGEKYHNPYKFKQKES